MDYVQNFPCISIMLCLFAGIISSGLRDKTAMWINAALLTVNTVLSACTLLYTLTIKEPFVYVMGKFPAPWGNEIRAGVLEALMALFFCVIMLLSLFGGRHKLLEEVEEDKTYLYYVLTDLLLSSLLALVYTNDMFTAYVFVEIHRRLRTHYDPAERANHRSRSQVHDHEPVRLRYAPAGTVYAL